MMHTSLTMKPSASFDNHQNATSAQNPCSPRQAYRKASNQQQHSSYFGSDEYSPTCVFAASFDSMAEQNHHYKQTATSNSTSLLEHQLSRISLTRSSSQVSAVAMNDFDQELVMTYTTPDEENYGPPQVRRTTTSVPAARRPANDSSRPSDPVARLLLSK